MTTAVAQPSLALQAVRESSTVLMADIAARMRAAGKPVIDLSAGRAPEPTHASVCEAATKAMQAGHTHQTPARGTPAYLEAVAAKLARENHLHYDPDQGLIATSGCKHGLWLSLLALLNPGDEVLVEDPCFVSYAPTIELQGARARAIPLLAEHDYRWTEAQLRAAVTERTRVILFCSPHNPLGVVHSWQDLDVLRRVALNHNLWVIVDEVYDAVTWSGQQHCALATLPGMAERTIGLMSTTKSFAMGGWRLGYAYGPAAAISRMEAIQGHLATCVSAINQMAGVQALSEETMLALRGDLWPVWEQRCRNTTDLLNGINGLSTTMPQGGFYCWLNIKATGINSETFSLRLLQEQGVSTVPGSAFGEQGEGFVRITAVKSEADVQEGVDRIQQFVAALG